MYALVNNRSEGNAPLTVQALVDQVSMTRGDPMMMKHPPRTFMKGYRPVVHAREGLMFGIRNPLDGPVFEDLAHAEQWCFHVMVDHYDRRLGMSDARIEPFKGMVDGYRTPPRDLLKDIERMCGEVAEENRQGRID